MIKSFVYGDKDKEFPGINNESGHGYLVSGLSNKRRKSIQGVDIFKSEMLIFPSEQNNDQGFIAILLIRLVNAY